MRDLKAECQHGIDSDLMCIRCQEVITRRQIDTLRGDASRSEAHFLVFDMHLLDIHRYNLKLFAEMLAKGKATL